MSLNSKLHQWVLKKSFIVFLVKIIGALTAFTLNVYLARVLGAEQFGIYSFVFSWVIILALFSNFGFEHLQARYVAAFKAKKNFGELISLIRSGHIFVPLLGAVVMALTISVLYIFNESISKDVIATFWWGALIIPVLAVINANNGILRGLKKQLHVSILFEVLRPLVLFIMVIGAVQYNPGFLAENVMSLTLWSLTLIFMLSMYWVNMYKRSETAGMLHDTDKHTEKGRLGFFKWPLEALPFILYTGVIQIERNTDILMLGSFDDMQSAGIYAVASKITTMLLLVTITLNTVASPVFSELFTLGKISKLAKLVSIVAKASSAIALAVLLVIYFYGEEIIGLFGEEFKEGANVLKMLAAAQFLKTLAGPVLMISIMTGLQKVALKVIMLGAVMHIILNFIFIPHWGVMGAAFSASLSIVLWSSSLSYLIYKKIGFNPSAFSGLK